MPDALSLSRSDLPEEIEKAIDELMWAAEIQGQDTIAGDDEVTGHSETHTNVCRMALTAAILSRLGEAEARGAPFGTGYSRAEPSGLGPEAEYPSRVRWQPIETAPKDDEQTILVCDARVAGGFHQVVWWDADSKQPEYRWDTSDGPKFHRDAFTHWMPLPAPPAQETEAEGQDARGGLVHEGSVAEGHAPALTEAGRLAIKDA